MSDEESRYEDAKRERYEDMCAELAPDPDHLAPCPEFAPDDCCLAHGHQVNPLTACDGCHCNVSHDWRPVGGHYTGRHPDFWICDRCGEES